VGVTVGVNTDHQARYPFRPVAGVGLEVDAPVSVVMAGVLGDP